MPGEQSIAPRLRQDLDRVGFQRAEAELRKLE